MATLKQYNEWRDRLTKLIDDTVTATKPASPEKAELYASLASQLREDTFKIQVAGIVKNGKSSFTNALIEEQVLPVDDIPCTAISSEVKYGPEKKALVSFYSPLPTGMLDEIPTETADYLRKNNLGKDKDGKDVTIPALNVPYDQLNAYVAIPEPDIEVMMDQDKYLAFQEKVATESPFSVANLYYPAELLKDGVQIVDTPGLDEHPKRTAVTLEYLKKADAVIFLMSTTQPAPQKEKDVINEILLPMGFKDLIMVVNKIDLAGNREKIRRYVEAQMCPYTTQKDCFGVSAKEFLDGKKEHNEAKIEQSGIPGFKNHLIDFLTRKKGDLKIKKSAIRIINSIENDFLNSFIPNRLAVLQADAVAVQQRVNDVTPKLQAIEARRLSLEQNFKQKIPLALIPVKEAITTYFASLEEKFTTWTTSYIHKHNCGMYANKNDLEIVAKEILDDVKKKVEEDYRTWNEGTLQPILEEQCQMVFGDVKENMMGMANDIAVIENILNGVNGMKVETTNVIERMAGIAAMAFLPLGHAGGDLFSGGFEFGRFLKNFMIDLGLGLGVGLVALWIWPPLGVVASIIGIAIGLFRGTENSIKKLKEQILAKIKGNLKDETPSKIAKIQEDIRNMFTDVQNSILKGVDSEIATSRSQLEELKRLASADQNRIDTDRNKLAQLRHTLAGIKQGMTELVKEVESIN